MITIEHAATVTTAFQKNLSSSIMDCYFYLMLICLSLAPEFNASNTCDCKMSDQTDHCMNNTVVPTITEEKLLLFHQQVKYGYESTFFVLLRLLVLVLLICSHVLMY